MEFTLLHTKIFAKFNNIIRHNLTEAVERGRLANPFTALRAL